MSKDAELLRKYVTAIDTSSFAKVAAWSSKEARKGEEGEREHCRKEGEAKDR